MVGLLKWLWIKLVGHQYGNCKECLGCRGKTIALTNHHAIAKGPIFVLALLNCGHDAHAPLIRLA